MDNIIKIGNLLGKTKRTLHKLLKIERKKTEILEQGSVEELNNLINSEQALIMECSSIEKQRVKLCRELDIDSITELFEKYPESKQAISPIHNELNTLVKELKKISGLNMRLLDTRLKIVRFITSQMGFETENPTYGKNAQKT